MFLCPMLKFRSIFVFLAIDLEITCDLKKNETEICFKCFPFTNFKHSLKLYKLLKLFKHLCFFHNFFLLNFKIFINEI